MYIGVLRLTSIGDVLIALHSAQKIYQNFDVDIVFITSPHLLPLLEMCPFIKYAYTSDLKFHQKKEGIWNSIPTPSNFFADPFLIIDLQNTQRSHSFLRQFKKIIPSFVYSVPQRRFMRIFEITKSKILSLIRSQKSKKPINSSTYIAFYQEDWVLKALSRDLTLLPQPKPFERNFPLTVMELPSQYLVFCLGSSGNLKNWPEEHFKNLGLLIFKNFPNLKVILTSGPEWKTARDSIAQTHPHFESRDLNLIETLEAIGKSIYVVTGDSFPSHACFLLNKPFSLLLGGTQPNLGFCPPQAIIESLYLSCSPCTRHGQGVCHYKNLKCLKDLLPQKIFQSIATYLKSLE